MTTGKQKIEYKIDRKVASKLLKVSIRTVDRYIKGKKLSTRNVDGRIWLSRKEIIDLKNRKSRQITVDNINMSTPKMSIDKTVDTVDKVVDKIELLNSKNGNHVSIKNRKNDDNKAVYKKLFEELQQEIKEKQERLEIANYRVGQLETQVRNSIPMLEYHSENYKRTKKEQSYISEIKKQKNILSKIYSKLREEKIKKILYLIILLLILALQPLWLIMINK